VSTWWKRFRAFACTLLRVDAYGHLGHRELASTRFLARHCCLLLPQPPSETVRSGWACVCCSANPFDCPSWTNAVIAAAAARAHHALGWACRQRRFRPMAAPAATKVMLSTPAGVQYARHCWAMPLCSRPTLGFACRQYRGWYEKERTPSSSSAVRTRKSNHWFPDGGMAVP